MRTQRLNCYIGVIVVCSALNACALIEKIGQDEELAEYAESVFRRQNSITSTIMMMSEEEIPKDSQLNQAEMAMHEACKLLNEYSLREMEGKPMGVLFRRRVKVSISGCDESIQEVEAILSDF